MNPTEPILVDARQEIPELIEQLLVLEQRLEQLTGGEVDSVASRDGRTFLLRRAQEQLRHREVGRQAAILNALPAHIALLDTQGVIIHVNEAWRQFSIVNVLHAPGHGVGLNYLTICDQARGNYSVEARQVAEGLRSVISGAAESFSIEYPCHSPTEQRWFQLIVTPLARDYPTGVVVMHLNITERRRIETRFRRLADSNVQGVIFWNIQGQITGANDAFLRMFGYTRDDLAAGKLRWADMTPPEFAAHDRHSLEEIAATGVCTPFEKEFMHKNGSRVPVFVGATTFEDNPDEGVCFVLNLTERKQLEKQFLQVQKMESIGNLAGGVAHDFNNLLAVIQGYGFLLLSDPDLSPDQTDYAKEIGAATQRAAALTRQLLMFGRQAVMQPRDLDLNESINDMSKMLRRTLGEDVEIQFKFSRQPLMIHADAGMMDQVLLNLAVNARDAMPMGGQLVVETAAVNLDASVTAQSVQARPGRFVCLSVSDTGCGIPPEIISRIFEPFFTTKDIGKGTGLGLATLFGIVQQHHGWVDVSSQVDQGTTFRVYLPQLADLPVAKTLPAGATTLRGGNETILLVEDDIFLRPSLCKSLSRLGYRVLEAGNGVEALEIWRQHRHEIMLVLTDLIMPGGMNGKELGTRLLEENPELKVIYASGYSADIIGKDFPLVEGVNFLVKPFQMHKLAQALRHNLDKLVTEM